MCIGEREDPINVKFESAAPLRHRFPWGREGEVGLSHQVAPSFRHNDLVICASIKRRFIINRKPYLLNEQVKLIELGTRPKMRVDFLIRILH